MSLWIDTTVELASIYVVLVMIVTNSFLGFLDNNFYSIFEQYTFCHKNLVMGDHEIYSSSYDFCCYLNWNENTK